MNIIANISCVIAIVMAIILIIVRKIPEQEIYCSGNLDVITSNNREGIISNLERVFGPATRHGMYKSLIFFNDRTRVSPLELILFVIRITKICDLYGQVAVESKKAKGEITFCWNGTLVYFCTNSVVFHFVIPKKNPNIC